jgi:hypothetical protein
VAKKLRVTPDGEIYVGGVLRLAGPKEMVFLVAGKYAHPLQDSVTRLESEHVEPLDTEICTRLMRAAGFVKDQNGVWRKIS